MARSVRGPARGTPAHEAPAPGRGFTAAVGATTTPARLLLDYLRLEGTGTVFGVPGGAIKDLLRELARDDGFRYVVCAHETGAAYMADAWARVTDRIGVVAVTSGPGATNAITGVMNAQICGSPVLTITGEVAQQYFGRGYLQEGFDAALDVHAAFSAATEYSAVVTSPQNFATLMEQSLREALRTPRRATHLAIPDDVAGAELAGVGVPASPTAYRAAPPGSDPDAAAEVVEMLAQAQRPVLLLGNGCRLALRHLAVAEALARLVEHLALPVMTTPNGKGLFPETHPMSLRNYGKAASPWSTAYCDGAITGAGPDLVLVLGSTLGDWATNAWHARLAPPGSRMVQIDADPSAIARSFPVHRGVIAEVGRFLMDLARLAQAEAAPQGAQARRDLVAQLKSEVAATPTGGRSGDPGPGLDPALVMSAFSDALAGPFAGAHVLVDSGNCVGWALGHLVVDPPTELHSSLAMGPMGFAVAGVVGAKLAQPDRPCVAIAGDGALLMHGSEIATAARCGVGPVWLVLDDRDLGMVTQGMAQFFGRRDPDVRWADQYALGFDAVAYATALGAEAMRVEDQAALPEALERTAKGAAAGVPQVVVVPVDRSAVPAYYPGGPR